MRRETIFSPTRHAFRAARKGDRVVAPFGTTGSDRRRRRYCESLPHPAEVKASQLFAVCFGVTAPSGAGGGLFYSFFVMFFFLTHPFLEKYSEVCLVLRVPHARDCTRGD